MPGVPQRDEASAPTESSALSPSEENSGANHPAAPDEKQNTSRLEESELEAALQLLVERAQYITGATGAALALPQGDEMVCRASAGSCAPAVGARLQVRSGLTGESIARRQLLRCDNAETDPRVNLETCRALGIASIVVLPMLRRNGEVRGLFELFSDHPYAFEERDLIALERMADLTLTALDLAEQRHGGIPPARPAKMPHASPQEKAPVSMALGPILKSVLQATDGTTAGAAVAAAAISSIPMIEAEISTLPAEPALAQVRPTAIETDAALSVSETEAVETSPVPVVPEAMRRVQKCSSCGFPISEGRALCLDCEKKQSEADQARIQPKKDESASAEDGAVSADENLPAFLVNAQPSKESWLSNPVNLLAILVLIFGVLVAIVVFR